MLRIGIITQARIGSTRLPEKILKKIDDKTLLQYHLERLKLSDLDIYVASTFEEGTEKIEDVCKSMSVSFFRGSTDDVLDRFFSCASSNKLDIIVRVTSDCPLIDGFEIKKAVHEYLKKDTDNLYYSNCINRTYPRGFDFEIFSIGMLKKAFEDSKSQSEREHVTPYFRNNPSLFKTEDHKRDSDDSHFRITVDTQKDFELIKRLIQGYQCEEKNSEEVINVMKQNPELAEINSDVLQKKV